MAERVTIKELVVKLIFDADTVKVEKFNTVMLLTAEAVKYGAKQFLEGLPAVQSFADKLANVVKNISIFGHVNRVVMGAVATAFDNLAIKAAAVVATTTLAVRENVQFVRSLHAVENATGLTADHIQRLAHAGAAYGLEFDQVADGLEDFTERVGEAYAAARRGDTLGDIGQALKDANVSLRDARGNLRPLSGLLDEFISGLGGIETASQRIAIARTIAGDDSAEFFLQASADASRFRQLMVEADAVVISPQALARSKSFTATVSVISSLFRGIRNQFADELIKRLLEFLTPARIKFILDGLRYGFSWVSSIATKMIGAAQWIVDLFGTFARLLAIVKILMIFIVSLWAVAGIATLAAIVMLVKAAYTALLPIMPYLMRLFPYIISSLRTVALNVGRILLSWLAILASLIVVAALITGIVLVVEDLVGYVQGADSVFGLMLDKLREMHPALAALADVLEYVFGGGIGNDLYTVIEATIRAVDVLGDRLGPIVDMAIRLAGMVASLVPGGAGMVAAGRALASLVPTASPASIGGGRVSNVSVGGSSVSVSVSGAGDPRAVGAEVARQAGGVLDQHATRLARNLSSPFLY